MTATRKFGRESLYLDADQEVSIIREKIREFLVRFRKKGAVVAMSGGIDSSVVAALCVAAIGKERVTGLLLPEKESSAETLRLSRLMAETLGIETIFEDISQVLDTVGCYRRRDESIRKVYPDFGDGYKAKIVLPNILENDGFRIFSIVILTPQGQELKIRLTPESYLGIVAATNFKQRVRKMFEYYHADRLNYAVVGTPNRLEYDQGFFVKLGDGAADLKPIAHLYKTQVYQIAAFLGVPREVQLRPPTTDTYSLPQSQEEFYFSLPYDLMDLCLFGKNSGRAISEIAEAVGLTEEGIKRIFRDIESKRVSSEYLHLPPQVFVDMKKR